MGLHTRASAQARAQRPLEQVNLRRTRAGRDRDGADYIEYKVRVLPDQLRRAELRLEHLRREARRLGLSDYLDERA